MFVSSHSAIAVAVIRDNARPRYAQPAEVDNGLMSTDYEALMTSCWHIDPSVRPTFLECMTRISAISSDVVGSAASSTTRTSSSSSVSSSHAQHHSSSSRSFDVGKGSSSSHSGLAAEAPQGEVVIVFTDITRAASLWEFNAQAMSQATLMHNQLVRRMVDRHGGYEVRHVRSNPGNGGEGSFCIAFREVDTALAWCEDTQRELLGLDWPEALLGHPGAAEEWGGTDDRVVFKGLRVRMGVHVGTPKTTSDPMTRRVGYTGPVVNLAAHITALAQGGQILMSEAARGKLGSSDGRAQPRQALKFRSVDALEGTYLHRKARTHTGVHHTTPGIYIRNTFV
jgi:class 3 adenylate cyclase